MQHMVNEPDVLEHLNRTDPDTGERGIDLVAVGVALLSQWKLALLTFVVVTAAGLFYVHTLKPQYVAAATFLPKNGNTEMASLTSIFQASGPGNLYIGLLRSRSVLDDVIKRADLMPYFRTQSPEFARIVLNGKTTMVQGTDGIIVLNVRDEDAQKAALIANAFLDALQDLSDKMAQSQFQKTRRFFDRQLVEEQLALDKAEDEFASHQIRTGEVAPDTQAAVGISNIAGLQGQIVGLQVQLSTLLQSESENNPDVVRLKGQIAALQAQKRKQEVGTGSEGVGAPIAASKIPTAALDLQRANREVQGHAARVASLNNQYGAARLDAEFSHAAFEVIDPAIAPEFRAWPPREPYEYACIGGGLFAAFVVVVFRLIGMRIYRTPEYREMFRRLRGAF
jgi:tyrosine-protein kinase Etk/Wzc